MTDVLLDHLPRFEPVRVLPPTDSDLRRTLRRPEVRRVRSLSLGPAGTNIVLASRRWIERMGVGDKAHIELCRTPEDAIETARLTTDDDVLDVFWTCAVYYREHHLFFENPDLVMFFSQEVMALDGMQLATTEDRVGLVRRIADVDPPRLRIAAHPSTVGLLRQVHLPSVRIVEATSNADAAQRCLRGEVEACITTSISQQTYGLASVHVFGSPDMVFFAGTTQLGARLVERVWLDLQVRADHGDHHRVEGSTSLLRT